MAISMVTLGEKSNTRRAHEHGTELAGKLGTDINPHSNLQFMPAHTCLPWELNARDTKLDFAIYACTHTPAVGAQCMWHVDDRGVASSGKDLYLSLVSSDFC